MPTILVTGGQGFIGTHLTRLLIDNGYYVRVAARNLTDTCRYSGTLEYINYDCSVPVSNYDDLLKDVDVVVHLAAIAHRNNVSSEEYTRVNTFASCELAKASASRGVKRFILISTVKVHGESSLTKNGAVLPYKETSPFVVTDHYSRSKIDAEIEIRKICYETNMELVIIRPPLVYGPGVKANFLRLLRFISRGWALPFAGIINQRSILYVENLCDLIEKLIRSESVKNNEYLVKDFDVSTPELVKEIADAFGVKARLFRIPAPVVRFISGLLNKPGIFDKLYTSLVIDDSRIRMDLGWSPPVDFQTGIKRTIRWFLSDDCKKLL